MHFLGCHSEPEPFDCAQDKLRAGEESRVVSASLRFLVVEPVLSAAQ